jgi:hypothetical protein
MQSSDKSCREKAKLRLVDGATTNTAVVPALSSDAQLRIGGQGRDDRRELVNIIGVQLFAHAKTITYVLSGRASWGRVVRRYWRAGHAESG